MMKSLTIELNHSEERILKRFASNQVRTPENLARYFIVRGLGLVDDIKQSQEMSKPVTNTLPKQMVNGFVNGNPS